MKKIFITIFLGFLAIAPVSVLAQDTKEVASEEKTNPSITIEFKGMEQFSKEIDNLEKEFDGEKVEVHYDDVRGLGGVLAIGLGFILFILAVCLASFIFWIAMIVHAVSNPIPSKAVWILILLIFGIIGAIIYYFAVKKVYVKKESTVDAQKV